MKKTLFGMMALIVLIAATLVSCDNRTGKAEENDLPE